MSDFRTYTTTVYSAVTTVRIYDEVLQHVVDEHPELPQILPHLPSMEAAVAGAIQNPTFIELSRPNTLVYVDPSTTNRAGDPLRVPVKIVEGTSARVTTFFFATPEGERQYVYRRENG